MKFLAMLGISLLLAFGSCDILVSSDLHKDFQDTNQWPIEGTSPPFHVYSGTDQVINTHTHTHIPRLFPLKVGNGVADIKEDTLLEKLRQKKQYYLSKLDALSASCKNNPKVFAHNVSSDSFQDPRIALLAKIISLKLAEIADISMEDLNMRLQNLGLLITTRMPAKILPLEEKIADLESKVQTLATKKTFTKIISKLKNFLSMKYDEITNILNTIFLKSHIITRSHQVNQLTDAVLLNISQMKHCEISRLFHEASERSYALKNEVASTKVKLFASLPSKDSASPTELVVLLHQLTEAARKNGAEILKLISAASAGIKPQTSKKLNSLRYALEATGLDPETSSFQLVKAPASITRVHSQNSSQT
ncbi:hypothetical protein SK128_003155, partial [Halocaridina rubra]